MDAIMTNVDNIDQNFEDVTTNILGISTNSAAISMNAKHISDLSNAVIVNSQAIGNGGSGDMTSIESAISAVENHLIQ